MIEVGLGDFGGTWLLTLVGLGDFGGTWWPWWDLMFKMGLCE